MVKHVNSTQIESITLRSMIAALGLLLSLASCAQEQEAAGAEAGRLDVEVEEKLTKALNPTSVLVEAIALNDDHVVMVMREDKALILLNLQPIMASLEGIDGDALQRLFDASALEYSRLAFEKFKDQPVVGSQILFAVIENMDEYNNPNFGGMVRLGTIEVNLASDGVRTILARDIDIDKVVEKIKE